MLFVLGSYQNYQKRAMIYQLKNFGRGESSLMCDRKGVLYSVHTKVPLNKLPSPALSDSLCLVEL